MAATGTQFVEKKWWVQDRGTLCVDLCESWRRCAQPSQERLLAIAAEKTPVYVYSAASIRGQIEKLRSLGVSRVFYAIKANPCPDVLKVVYEAGFGFECVSPGELHHVLGLFPTIDRSTRILFTPNFAPRTEYEEGFKLGVNVTVDSVYPLKHWGPIFKDKRIFLRMDPGAGRGHHAHVQTGGKMSKFGIDASSCAEVAELVKANGATVVGLHAHAGSGILKEVENWLEVGNVLIEMKKNFFPSVEVLDLGGGLGVVQNPTKGDEPLPLEIVQKTLAKFKEEHKDVSLWMEPGRFIIAESGVLLAKVTQIKEKGSEKRYVGVDSGFHDLIRPMLYGAYHHIVNLTRLHEPTSWTASIVGMICESGDVFGSDRAIAPCQEGDVVLIDVAGAYGKAMSSHYNIREPAREVMLQ